MGIAEYKTQEQEMSCMQWHSFTLKKFILLFLAIIAVSMGTAQFVAREESQREIPAFKNVIEDSGITLNRGTWGAAWADYDGDGWLDLTLFAGRGNLLLYKNRGDGTFTDVTERTGIEPPGAFAVAGAFGDYNNDGCPDLYLAQGGWLRGESGVPSDMLYQNNCDGTFSTITKEAGIKNLYYGIGVAWADYNNDGFLDIYVANRGSIDKEGVYVYEPNILWRNNGDGTFTDVALELGVTGVASSCLDSSRYLPEIPSDAQKLKKMAFQTVWFDYNNDNLPDLFVATEELPSPLYRNRGDGTFAEVTAEAGLCRSASNMGVAVGDYNNDGFIDLYVTNEGANYLWRNNGDGTFRQDANILGVEDAKSLGWGTEFLDYNNDGYLDIYVANGRIPERNIILRFDKLYKNKEGEEFLEVASLEGIKGNTITRAFAFGDYNNDGFVDLFVGSSPFANRINHRLYQNQTNKNNWFTVQLIGTKSNRDAIGARIVATIGSVRQTREVRSGASYASQNSLWQTFGLGSASIVDTLKVHWPSGARTEIHNIGANQKIVIIEGE